MPADLKAPFSESGSKEDLAWAAGLFEGEGTFSSRLQGKKQSDRALVASIRMTDEDTVKKFASIVGVGHLTGPWQPKNPRYKPLWTWAATSFEECQAVMAMLYSWLGIRRKANILQQLKDYRDAKPTGIFGRDKTTGRFTILKAA